MFNSLLKTLKNEHPNFIFRPANKFLFRPPKTIFYDPNDQNASQLILHELGHALLGHQTFDTNIKRLKMERAAWNQALILAKTYQIEIDDDLIEGELDSYRDWLHQKSRCKKCGSTCYQTKDQKYHCPFCEAQK